MARYKGYEIVLQAEGYAANGFGYFKTEQDAQDWIDESANMSDEDYPNHGRPESEGGGF